MTGTRTGKGGFEVNGKVYDFDPGDPNAPGSDFGDPDHGDINVDNSTKDLSKKTKSTLSKYLSESTLGGQSSHGYAKGTPNAYPIESGVQDFSISDPKGYPAGLEDKVNTPQFVKRSGVTSTVADVPSDKRQKGPTGAPHAKPTIEDPIDTLGDLAKGKVQGKKADGNTLLPGVAKDNQGAIVGGYTSKVLANNRFTADGAHLSDETTYNIHGRVVSAEVLKSVGVMLSLRGAQEFPAAFQSDVNPQNAGSIAGALIPSPNQSGVLKVPKVLLEAQDALNNIASDADVPTELTISPIGDQSWGALNNVEEPWSGTLNLGMIAMALALQVAMLLAFEGLGALIGLIGSGGAPPSTSRNPDGTYTKGSYLATPLANPNNVGFPPNLMALLGLHGTRFPFGDALKTGAAAFFVGGDKAKEGLGSQLVGAPTSAVSNALSDNSSAGFLIILSRQIIRVGQVIAAQIEKIASAFASNPISGIKGILGLLDIIKQSKLIAAINIFTTLGDAILSESEYSKDTSGPADKGMHSSIDAYPDDSPGASVRKSRLKRPASPDGHKLKLAWASNRAPATYLLPDAIATMTLVDAKLGSFKGPFGTSDPDSRGAVFVQTQKDREQNGARIPRESKDPTGIDVKKMEALLEAEYMPFYFHDLRTNEIISFHAFMASLTDDYAANWETVDGYGRVDPVKIYKSTARRINMSFYIIATDPKDFDEMWLKINKLVTLVYPQYTKGRLLTDGTTSFVQPFSQLIGASPLIRIRLGDLLRSNYSRFALARLFGAADGDMKLEGDIKFEGAQGIVEKTKAAIAKATDDKSNEFFLTSNEWPAAMEAGGVGLSLSLGGPKTPDQAPNLAIDHGDLPFFKFTVTSTLSNGMLAVKPALLEATDLTELYNFTPDDAAKQAAALKNKYENDKNPNTKVVGGEAGYSVPKGSLTLTPKSFKKIVSNSGAASAITNIEKLSTFLDIEKNALVKSFRAIQGKGLGGVIESMNFDWYDKVTWDVRPDHRAPKMCKVTLAFAPIHDISPGIDHLGYNRAPIYPAGGAMSMGVDPDKKG